MNLHNKRSPKQWEIISKYIDFEGKRVLDLGCGYGDVMYKCNEAGATVDGVDIEYNLPVLPGLSTFYHQPIEEFITQERTRWDIIICFSVLPYLKNPDSVLRWIKHHSDIALIECQYAGDGYGPTEIENDANMKSWLSHFEWESIEAIGRTLVEDRKTTRTIWMCR